MTSRLRRNGLVAVTAAAALAGSALVAAPAFAAGPDPEAFAAGVTTAEVMAHLQEFQQIADDNDGNRASGTSGYDASGAYVEGLLEAAGYDVERQQFDFVYTETVAETLTAGGEDVPVIVMSYSPSTAEGGVTADLVALTGEAQGCTPAEGVEPDPMPDLTGQIVVLQRGTCSFAEKQANVSAAGAVGALIYNNTEGPLNGTLGGPVEGAPIGGLTQADGVALVEAIGNGTVSATLDLRQIAEDRTTFNVIAQPPYGDTENVVMLGAHLDSVVEGAGINDNGSGSAGILQVALELADAEETTNAVRFAFWGAEEAGLLGSYEYVDALTEEEADAIAGYLNFDMIGSPNYIIGVYDADESTFAAPVQVPVGSERLEQVFTDYFDSTDQAWVDTEFSGRSDYAGFIELGIPASGLFTGADDVKTEEEAELFGGIVGEAHDQNYHSVGDDIDNIDETALEINVEAIAFATAVLADDPTPTALRSGPELERLAGDNRYSTAATIAVDTFGTSEQVLLARADDFADAMTGSYLSGVFGAPVLLTDTDSLPPATAAALEELGATDITVLGGTSAVSDEVVSSLENDDYTVQRISGPNRYATAAKIATAAAGDETESDSRTIGMVSDSRTAVLGNGQAFPDILAAGPLSFAENLPLMITMPTALTAETASLLEELDIEQVVIVGGTAAVSAAVELQVEDIVGSDAIRLDGTGGPEGQAFDRYATARHIADFAYDELGFDESLVDLARGDDFADALAGGPHAGAERSPIVLTRPTALPATTQELFERRCATIAGGHAFGGTAAISSDVLDEIAAISC